MRDIEPRAAACTKLRLTDEQLVDLFALVDQAHEEVRRAEVLVEARELELLATPLMRVRESLWTAKRDLEPLVRELEERNVREVRAALAPFRGRR